MRETDTIVTRAMTGATVRCIRTPEIVGYEEAVGRSWQVHDAVEKRGQSITEQDVTTYVPILYDLLRYSEEVCYPTHRYLLEMLQLPQTQSGQSWEEIWQTYLREQMRSGTYLTYQGCALLWMTLFSEPKAQQALAALLLNDLSISIRQRHVQRFLLGIVEDFRDLGDLGDLIDILFKTTSYR